MTKRALACGAAVGLLEAARALASLPHVRAIDGFLVIALATTAYALLGAAIALALRPVVGARRRCRDAPSGVFDERSDWALPTGVAGGVLVATWRLRGFGALAQPELLVGFAPGPLLEGLFAGLAFAWGASRLPARRLRAAWWTLAALGLAVATISTVREELAERFTPPYDGRRRPNLLLVSIDTLRADRLGAYGSSPGLTPVLDRLAAQGTTFERAASPMPLTGPTHTTLLTGLEPARHGVLRNGIRLRAEVETVAEMLARAGYRTGGFVSAWPLTDAASGLARRFERYDEDLPTRYGVPRVVDRLPLVWLADRTAMSVLDAGSSAERRGRFLGEIHERDGARTVERALAWIARRDDQPYLAFVHLYEPHVPYVPPAALVRAMAPGDEPARWRFDRSPREMWLEERFTDRAEVAAVRRLYDAEVAHADELVGHLLAGVDHFDHGEETIVVFTADHGEGLGEHGELFDHSEFLYETTMHVPLLVRLPGGVGAGRRVDELVTLADVAPTVLELAAVAPNGSLDGRSLVPLLRGDASGGERLAHGTGGGAILRRGGIALPLRHSVRDRRYKLIWTLDKSWPYRGGPTFEELYDLASDPGELRNLVPNESEPEAVERLRGALRERLARRSADVGPLDPETVRRLNSLGYL